MTAQEQHPGLLAIDLQAKFVVTRNKARGLRDKAAGLRREAKTTKLSVDAAKLRRDAKPMTEEAKDLELEAKGVKAKVVMHTTAATELLNKRMPPRVRPVGDHEDTRLCQGAWGAGGPAKAYSPQSASRNSGNQSAAKP